MSDSLLNTQIAIYSSLSEEEIEFNIYDNPLFQALKIVSKNISGYTIQDNFKSLNYFSELIKLHNEIKENKFMNLSYDDLLEIKKSLDNLEKIDNQIISDRFNQKIATTIKLVNFIEDVEEVKKISEIKLKKLIRNLDICINRNSLPDFDNREYSLNVINTYPLIDLSLRMNEIDVNNITAKDDYNKIKNLLGDFNYKYSNEMDDINFAEKFVKKIFVPIIRTDIKIQSFLQDFQNSKEQTEKTLILKEIKKEIENIAVIMGAPKESVQFVEKYIRQQELKGKIVEKETTDMHVKAKI